MGVHSVVLVDGTTVSVIYDIEPDVSGSGLHFEFELPALVSSEDVRAFGEWLASSGYVGRCIEFAACTGLRRSRVGSAITFDPVRGHMCRPKRSV